MSQNQKVIGWCLLTAVLAGCSTGPKFNPRASQGNVASPYFTSVAQSNQLSVEWLKPPKDFYRLGPGDTLEIETIGEPASRSGATVGPDGKIYYGILPGTFVWGMTLTDAKEALEQGFAKYLTTKPEVMLNLTTVASKRVWVLGQVRRPGVYAMGAPLTLLETISAAGGTTLIPGLSGEVADLEKSFVMRGGQVLPVNFQRLLRQGDMTQNIYLQPDDFVYLRASESSTVSVFGAVTRPGLVDFGPNTTLLSALAAVGGTVPYAYVSEVILVRGSLTQPRYATVDYNKIRHGEATDVPLMAGDIIYVQYRPTMKLELLVNTMMNEFVRSIAVNEGVRAVSSSASPISPSVAVGAGAR
jgi:polysaccharide biosynthesis/export protein